jgi:EAL domain-containing protein (putative c-di-GMP-specific phosphodiesterase class I)
MAHKLGIRVIAEGVESVAQEQILKDFNCDFGQGYFYSRPVPARNFEALLAEMQSTGCSTAKKSSV